MLLFLISLLNWIFMDIYILKFLIALIIFIVVETKRKNHNASKLEIAGSFISALVVVAMLLYIVAGVIMKFL